MKKNKRSLKVLLFSCLLAGIFSTSTLQAADRPNIVLFFIDDMGYGDIGPFGATLSKTPHIDRLADEGIKLTSFYVSNTACTPSRSALMTGCYADRVGMDRGVVFPGDKRGLNPEEITIAEMLKEAGYATGCVGKWHLGDDPKFMPDKQGFDYYTGIPYSNDMWPGKKNRVPLPFIKNHKTVAHISDGRDQALLGDALSDAAVEFITENKDKPFFLYFPHSMVHFPRYVLKERADKYKDQPDIGDKMTIKIQIEEIDDSVGHVVKTLEKFNIAENTLIFFTSDNGGSGNTSKGELRGGKGGAKYEGHMRVCTVAKWPKKIPAGIVSDEIGATIDLLPTLAKFTGAKVPDDRIIDGKDISSFFTNASAKSPHKYLFYEYEGVRRDNWKMVIPKFGKKRKNKSAPKPELYDLSTDIGEKKNLSDQHPEIVKEFQNVLKAHKERVQSKQRPAALVENPKPISTEGLPSLAAYLGRENVEILSDGKTKTKNTKTKKKK